MHTFQESEILGISLFNDVLLASIYTFFCCIKFISRNIKPMFVFLRNVAIVGCHLYCDIASLADVDRWDTCIEICKLEIHPC